MRHLLTFLSVILFMGASVAQVPQQMNYQAVIRDSLGHLVKEQSVSMQISILQGSDKGMPVYTERQIATTNANGLVSVIVGAGATSCDFSSIDWSQGPFFIKTKTDIRGGTNYNIVATSPLLSVPYALHSRTSEKVIGDIGMMPSRAPFYLGQDTLGGIVFYLYTDAQGKQRGLIVSTKETRAKWQEGEVEVQASRTEDGAYNTMRMRNSPAKEWVNANFGNDWYLPSIDELTLLQKNRFHVNRALRAGNHTLLATKGSYWSSTEDSYNMAFVIFLYNGITPIYDKSTTFRVRAVRAF